MKELFLRINMHVIHQTFRNSVFSTTLKSNNYTILEGHDTDDFLKKKHKFEFNSCGSFLISNPWVYISACLGKYTSGHACASTIVDFLRYLAICI